MSQEYIVINKASALSADVLFVLKDLDQQFFSTPWSCESWDNLFLEGSERFILINKLQGIVVGFTLFELNHVDSFAHLLKILVDPLYRGQKIGKQLLNESIKTLNERGIQNYFLEVEEENLIARNLYESVGFKFIHKKKHFYNDGSNAIIMTLSV